jgi:HSP20 family protein
LKNKTPNPSVPAWVQQGCSARNLILGAAMFIVPTTRDARHFSRLFDDTLERYFAPASAATAETPTARNPALDVAESDRAYTVKLDMPGVAKEDVKVSIEGRQVNVQAQSEKADERREGERVVYRERSATAYVRSFTLAAEVDQTEAQAKLENGVLTLTLPKRGARSAAQLTVN